MTRKQARDELLTDMGNVRRYMNNGSRLDCGPYAIAIAEMHKSLERYTFTDIVGDVAAKVVQSIQDKVGDLVEFP